MTDRREGVSVLWYCNNDLARTETLEEPGF